MIKITVKNKAYNYPQGTTLEAIKDELKIVAYTALVNNRLRELTYPLTNDAKVVFLDLKNKEATRIYEASLRFLILKAIKNLYPLASVKYNYSISRSILAIVKDLGVNLSNEILAKIENEARRIIALDLPIKRHRIEIEQAKAIYEKHGYYDKIDVLNYREENYVNNYICGNYQNYMFSYMLPSTGYIDEFKLILYHPGFMIQYPRSDANGKIPPFDDAPIFNKTIKEAARWSKIIDGDLIAQINRYVEADQAIEFVNMCETKHNRQLAELGYQISSNIDEIRLICIAGPSSSGKTTFSTRLKIELLSWGIKPVMISIDDYYKVREQAPLDEHGKPDLEHIDAIDVALFNDHITKLVNNEEVIPPVFNFNKGVRELGKPIKIEKGSPIIIEGIHALNDALTPGIPLNQKYKIFIAPQTQLHIDNHNPISFTDLRLLRRMVRDQQFRNSSAEETLAMWDSVRAGEFKWIYQFQETADYVFNSELSYEFLVLKKHAYKSLNSIPRESEYFITANKLLKFLKYFCQIDDHLVPNNSILREFIGNSIFK
ncbi:MAG: nucleoside kinase [Acholeplasmataceae bacterium]|jgi:uridine kinase|nr:nucleoside kinase [Acholeplasmataceae bacterium]